MSRFVWWVHSQYFVARNMKRKVIIRNTTGTINTNSPVDVFTEVKFGRRELYITGYIPHMYIVAVKTKKGIADKNLIIFIPRSSSSPNGIGGSSMPFFIM